MPLLRDLTRYWRRYNADDPALRLLARERRRQQKRRAAVRRAALARLLIFSLLIFCFIIASHGVRAFRNLFTSRRSLHIARNLLPSSSKGSKSSSSRESRIARASLRPPQFGRPNGDPALRAVNASIRAFAPRPHRGTFPDAVRADDERQQRMFTRRCFRSKEAGDTVCVHRPLCARSTGLVYIADMLECVTSTTKAQCIGIERAAEDGAELAELVSKPHFWLSRLDVAGQVQWYEGGTILVHLGRRALSVVQYAHRILMVHHLLMHPARYGFSGVGAISNIVLVADEVVLKKIRFSKSWHHWLLSAVVHPHPLILSHASAARVVGKVAAPGELRVFVTAGWGGLSPGNDVPCFRHAVYASGLRSRFFLERAAYPRVGASSTQQDLAMTGARSDADAMHFRALTYAATGRALAPVRRRVVYLHRAHTRALSLDGSAKLERVLEHCASVAGFSYTLVDIEGLPFSAVLAAVGDAGVVVGVHGTQLLATLFLGSGAAIVEIFPYMFANTLYARPSGADVRYAAHSVVHGTDYANVYKYSSAAACQAASPRCRSWYRSDSRPVLFGRVDAEKVTVLVRRSIRHVMEHTKT